MITFSFKRGRWKYWNRQSTNKLERRW